MQWQAAIGRMQLQSRGKCQPPPPPPPSLVQLLGSVPASSIPSAPHCSHQLPMMPCTCGKCIASILSPRLAYRLQHTCTSAADMIVDSISWPGAAANSFFRWASE